MPRNQADPAEIQRNRDAFFGGVKNLFGAGPYSAGYITVPGKGRRYRDSNGNYYDEAPGFGRQTLTELSGVKRNPLRNMAVDMPGMNQDGSLNLRSIPLIGGLVNNVREMAGAGIGGQIPRQGQGETVRPAQPTGQPVTDTDRGAGLGRNESRVSPTGVEQKGTQTGPAPTPIDTNKSFDTLLAEMGLTNYYNGTAFTSNQLPTTDSNPYSANNKGITPTFDADAPGVTGNSYDNYGADGGAAAASKPLIDGNEKFQSDAPKIEGGSERVSGGSLQSALSDTASMRRDTEGMRELQARAAFLDADDSMTGLKRAQATRGVVYAGGQHYIASGDGKQAINKDEARGINAGKITPQELLKRYTNNISASDSQRPVESNDSTSTPVSGEGRQGLSMIDNENKGNTPKSTPNVGTEVDFDNNNGGAPTKFKPPASFKPQYGSNLPARSNVWGG